MKALSLRQPWAYAVVHLGKRLENRNWSKNNPNRKFRGVFLIHASASATRDDREDYDDMLWILSHVDGMISRKKLLAVPDFDQFDRGGIVGLAEVTGLVTEAADPWFFGPIALTLDNVRELPFTPCKGMLGFFNVDAQAIGLTDKLTDARVLDPRVSAHAA